MKDLLKEAIADAKAVRQTALANAKMALEEAFTPRLQSMLSAKLAEDLSDDESTAVEEDEEEEGMGMKAKTEMEEGDEDDTMPDEGDEDEEDEEDSDDRGLESEPADDDQVIEDDLDLGNMPYSNSFPGMSEYMLNKFCR